MSSEALKIIVMGRCNERMYFMKYTGLINGFLSVSAALPREKSSKDRLSKRLRQLLNRDISDIVSKQTFEKIVQYILSNGDRMTYCNMYNNNPHYDLEGCDVFLNPLSQRLDHLLSGSVSDYDTIVIKDWGSRHTYYEIMLVEGRVYIYNPYEAEPTGYENEILTKYIPKLKLLIGRQD